MIDYNMFKKERKEHPTLPNEDVKQIVIDHMKEENESPSQYAVNKLRERFRK